MNEGGDIVKKSGADSKRLLTGSIESIMKETKNIWLLDVPEEEMLCGTTAKHTTRIWLNLQRKDRKEKDPIVVLGLGLVEVIWGRLRMSIVI